MHSRNGHGSAVELTTVWCHNDGLGGRAARKFRAGEALAKRRTQAGKELSGEDASVTSFEAFSDLNDLIPDKRQAAMPELTVRQLRQYQHVIRVLYSLSLLERPQRKYGMLVCSQLLLVHFVIGN